MVGTKKQHFRELSSHDGGGTHFDHV